MADPGHPEHQEYVEWIGVDFDAEVFDVAEINARLGALSVEP